MSNSILVDVFGRMAQLMRTEGEEAVRGRGTSRLSARMENRSQIGVSQADDRGCSLINRSCSARS